MGYITNVLILEILSRSSTYSTFKAYIICNRDISKKNSFVICFREKIIWLNPTNAKKEKHLILECKL